MEESSTQSSSGIQGRCASADVLKAAGWTGTASNGPALREQEQHEQLSRGPLWRERGRTCFAELLGWGKGKADLVEKLTSKRFRGESMGKKERTNAP